MTNRDGVAVARLDENGLYAINVEADGYLFHEANTTLTCNSRNCEASCGGAGIIIDVEPEFC